MRELTCRLTHHQGGTSGIGAAVARELASRGAQLILLTQHKLTDPFLADYIMDLRDATNNELITAEHCDLSSLHSIRLFATKWVDNAPPRRLDMIILCANTMTPAGSKATQTEDGLETNWGINYMANFHLLSILSPALRAQPPDRDVRIIFGMCASYLGGDLTHLLPADSDEKHARSSKSRANAKTSAADPKLLRFTPATAYAGSKLALLTFAWSFQKHLSSYVRPDKAPMNARVLVVDPGWTRTSGMQRYLTFGSLWGLLFYLVLYPFWWLVLKSPSQGAQSFLHAAMEAGFGTGLMKGEGDVGQPEVQAAVLKECRKIAVMRPEVKDVAMQKALWQESERTIEVLEKEGAVRRAKMRKEKQGTEKREGVDPTEENVAKRAEDSVEKAAGSRRSKKAAGGNWFVPAVIHAVSGYKTRPTTSP